MFKNKNLKVLLSIPFIYKANACDVNDLYVKADALIVSTYCKINSNWDYIDTNSVKPSSTPSFDRMTIETRNGFTPALIWSQKQQPNLLNAIDEAINSPLQTDCATAARFARIKLIGDLIGNDKFENLVNTYSQKYQGFNLLSALSWDFFTPQTTLKGPGVYAYPFVNIPEYATYKPTGPSGNHNIFRLSSNTYMGFCPDFFNQPRRVESLETYMFESFMDNNYVLIKRAQEYNTYKYSLTLELFKANREKYQSYISFYKLDMEKINKNQ